MENASKALIMAASVLIALMIIAGLILMFNNIHNFQNSGTQNTREAQVVEFNNQYETYNRNSVRGSDLYSLLNRVSDYNRRKSTEGNVGTDQGQYLAYEPMTITFKLDSKKDKFWYDSSIEHLINNNEVTQSDRKNEFGDGIKDKVDALEKKYGSDSLVNLTTSIGKIFDSKEKSSVYAFKSAYKRNKFDGIDLNNYNIESNWETFWNRYLSTTGSKSIREDVLKYYEYIQFKRAIFDCKSVEYNQKTGRIIKLEFKFTGKFN